MQRRLALAVAVCAVGAAVTAVLVWDIPHLPV
jgi:hypothetical protein